MARFNLRRPSSSPSLSPPSPAPPSSHPHVDAVHRGLVFLDAALPLRLVGAPVVVAGVPLGVDVVDGSFVSLGRGRGEGGHLLEKGGGGERKERERQH